MTNRTALELLGKVPDAEFTANTGEQLRLAPNVFADWLELVAERAREEAYRRAVEFTENYIGAHPSLTAQMGSLPTKAGL